MSRSMQPNDVGRRTLLRAGAGLGLAAAASPLLAACGGSAAGARNVAVPRSSASWPPPETTRIVIPKTFPVSCVAASAMAETFLREEGFTEIVYRNMPLGEYLTRLGSEELDFGMAYGTAYLERIDHGAPIVILGGMHVGCWQVFASGRIRSLRDLKGGKIGIPGPGVAHVFRALLGATLASVGIDLKSDVTLVEYTPKEAPGLLATGRVDGLLALPPMSQKLRAAKVGRVVLNSAVDRPWSSYYCCMPAVNANWKRRYPVATNRALRAYLRAADAVAAQPHHAAQVMVDHAFTDDLALAKENLRELPYDVWRRYDPADTVRYYALRMQEAGLIKSTPQQLLDHGCDFSTFDELRRTV